MPHEFGHVLPPGEYTIEPYDPEGAKAAEFLAWQKAATAAAGLDWMFPDIDPNEQRLLVDPLPGSDVQGYAWPPPPHGAQLTDDQAIRLQKARLLLDPDTGQPFYPLPQGAIQYLANPLNPLIELGQEALGYAELAGEGWISMVEDMMYPGSGVPGADTPRQARTRDELAAFQEEQGRGPHLYEYSGLSAKVTPLPTGMRPLIYAAADPLNVLVPLGMTTKATKALVGGVATVDSDAVRKLIKALGEAAPVREAQEVSYKGQRAERIEAFLKDMEEMEALQGGPSEAVYAEAMKKLRGEFAKQDYTALRTVLDEKEFQELFEIVRYHDMEGYAVINNMNAFNALMFGKEVPQAAQLRRLEQMFGTELVDAVVGSRSNGTWQTVMDVIGLPRAIVASFDLSAPLRQGRALGVGNPKEFVQSFKSMFMVLGPRGEANTLAVEQAIKEHRFFNLAENSGLFFAERAGVVGRSSAAEEAFVSRFASAIPGIKISERAYTTFLNKFRHDIFYKHAAEMAGTATRDDFKALARMINYGTGRGPLPPQMGATLANMASAVFFAPRFMTSQPAFLLRGGYDLARSSSFNKGVSRAFAKNLVAFFGSGMSMLGIVDLIGNRMRAEGISVLEAPSVEWDPRSSDYAKIKLGNTRLDMWGGYQPLIRYSAQFITGEKKRLNSGDIIDFPRSETFWRLIQTKLSPAGAAGRDLITGENFLGEEMEWSWDVAGREAWKRLIPMVAQDLADAYNHANNPMEMVKAAPAIFGVGAQTFQTTADLMNHISMRDFGMLHDDLGMSSADRDAVKNSWEVVEHHAEFEKKQGPQRSTQERISYGMSAYRDRKEVLESKLREAIEDGARGRALRDAVQAYLTDKRGAYLALFPDDLQQYMRDQEDDPRAIYQDRYWSVIPVENLKTGFVDFGPMEDEQQKILAEAEAAGLDPDDIKYRAMVGDPQVQTLLVQYRQDQEALRRWFGLERKFAEDFGLLEGWLRYKDSLFSELVLEMETVPSAVPGPQPGGVGITLGQLLKAVKMEKRRIREFGWDGRGDPNVERMLIRWGYIKPTNALHPANQGEVLADIEYEMGLGDL